MIICLSYQSTAKEFIQTAGSFEVYVTTKLIPYRSGYSVYNIGGDINLLATHIRTKLENTRTSLVRSLNWLSIATQQDIAIITNILSTYLHKGTQSHLPAVKHTIKYLKGTTDIRICFSTVFRDKMYNFY